MCVCVCVEVGDGKLGKSYFNLENITMQYVTKNHLLLSLADEQGGLEPACTGWQKPMAGISSQLGISCDHTGCSMPALIGVVIPQ